MKTTTFNKLVELFQHMLNEAIDKKALTRSSLAKLIDKDRSTITRWLSYDQEPLLSTVSTIATKLGYSVEKKGDKWLLITLDEIKPTTNELSFTPRILYEVLEGVLNEAQDSEKAILGKYFLKISNQFTQMVYEQPASYSAKDAASEDQGSE